MLIDWFRVLRSDERGDRFAAWGIINDPGCCTPGSDGCPAKSLDETYGFDWCPGDEALLKFVGSEGYRDPACDFKDAPVDANDVHHGNEGPAPVGVRSRVRHLHRRARLPQVSQSALRPRSAGRTLNGGRRELGRLQRKLSDEPATSDSRGSQLADGSIEPPFLIGTSCGSCHIAFDPLNPPADPAHPKWENIKGVVGNQYTRISEILGSGMSPRHARVADVRARAPGHVRHLGDPDRPGQQPRHDQRDHQHGAPADVRERSRRSSGARSTSCAADDDGADCWCEPGRDGKCWRRSDARRPVHHILKGGEDSIGALEAIQRVYFNIGSCAEQCWVNHLTDLRQLDPQQRNFGQTPFDIGQCRRDCPNFRAIEDRLPDILAS